MIKENSKDNSTISGVKNKAKDHKEAAKNPSETTEDLDEYGKELPHVTRHLSDGKVIEGMNILDVKTLLATFRKEMKKDVFGLVKDSVSDYLLKTKKRLDDEKAKAAIIASVQ